MTGHGTHSPPLDTERQAPARSVHSPEEPKESWLLRTGLSLSVWTLAGVATVLAASGQVEFARWAGINDMRAYAVPAVLELVAVAFLLIGYRRARRGDSAVTLWLLAAAVGAFAVYTNVVHSGGRAGLVFGGASAITMVLWFVKLRDDYRHFQRHTGQATRPRPKLGALWLVAPRLSTRAWVVATRRRISTVDEAVGYAEVWRAVYEDARTAKVGRRLARRTAWRSVAEAAGGVWAELPRTAEIAAVQVLNRPSPPPDPHGAIAAREAGAALGGAPVGPGLTPQVPVPASAPTPVSVSVSVPVPAAAVMGNDVAIASGGAQSGPVSLRERVYAFLDSLDSVGGIFDDWDGDDPDVLWSTADSLNVSVDEVAEYVREWFLRFAPHGYDEYIADPYRIGSWPTGDPAAQHNHRASPLT
jgi:hypothetical protein